MHICQNNQVPVCVFLATECGRHEVAFVCMNGLHNRALLRISLGGGGWIITCGGCGAWKLTPQWNCTTLGLLHFHT